MAVNGKYSVTIETPIGPQISVITFSTEGTTLIGETQIVGTPIKFTGTINGDNAKWSSTIPSPMGGYITLFFDLFITPTDLSGNVQLGEYGMGAVSGKRIN